MIPILSDKYPFEGNGIGRLADAISCVITHEINGEYELQMLYPVTGLRYGDLTEGLLIMARPDNNTPAQAFRIYRITKPLNGIITVYARHLAYDMSGAVVNPFVAADLQAALAAAISSAVPSPAFTLTSSRSVPSTMTVKTPIPLWSLLGGTQGSFLDVYGGEWDFDNLTADLKSSLGSNRGVIVRYGKNLTDLEQDVTIEATWAYVYPYWQGEDGTLVRLPEYYVAVPGATGDRVLLVDFSSEFDEAPTVAQLRAMAQKYIQDNDPGSQKISWKVSFVQLAQCGEYETQAILERVQLGDTLMVDYEPLDLHSSARVVKAEFDVLLDRYNTVTLGRVKQNLSKIVAATPAEIARAVNAAKSAMEKAIESSTDFITHGAGYMRFIYNENNELQEIVSLDNPDITLAQSVWRWNNGGFGHSSSGYGGPYTTAITQDGSIVADFITSGEMSANHVRAGIIQSQSGNSYWNLDTGEFYNSALKTTLDNMQAQIDDAVETFTGSAVPTLSNYPASSWTTDHDKDLHIGDLYVVNSEGGDYEGFYYRFEKTGSTYQWTLLKDTEVTKALADAEEALRRVGVAETQIEQNSEAIALRATKTEAQGYATTAKSEAISSANSATDQKLLNYSTTSEMNAAIEVSAESITSTVSSTYETKTDATSKLNTAKTYAEGQASTAQANAISTASTDATNKANAAESAAKGYTDTKLTSYSTTVEMNSAISQSASDISATVAATYTTKEEFNNLEIGGRNYAWAVSEDYHPSLFKKQVCTYTYDSSQNGKYILTATANTNRPQIWFNAPGYDIPTELAGQDIIFHADEITRSNPDCAPRLYLIFYDSSGKEVMSRYLSPTTLSMNITVPANAVKITLVIRIAQNYQVVTVGDTLTVVGLKLERGTKATDWTPAPEDVEAEIGALDTRVTSAEATLTVQAGEIATKVSETDYNGNTIASKINQTATTVQIEAEKINLTGAVAVTDLTSALQAEVAKGQEALTAAGTAQTTANIAIANTPTINLLPPVYYHENASGNPYVASGITWTLNLDGSITAKGTASVNVSYSLTNTILTVGVPVLTLDPAKRYFLSGCPSGGSNTTYRIGCRSTPDGTTPSSSSGSVNYDYGTGVQIPANRKYFYTYCQIMKGYTTPEDGITFYPMLEVGTSASGYVSSHSSAALDKANSAASQEQLVYKSAASGTTSMAAPTSWVSNRTGGQNLWTAVRPEYSSTYPVLFVATQSRSVGGTLSCTTPVIDKTTTIIDGGNIVTNSITADKININDLFSQNITATNMNITGGSIRVSTDTASASVITLTYYASSLSLTAQGAHAYGEKTTSSPAMHSSLLASGMGVYRGDGELIYPVAWLSGVSGSNGFGGELRLATVDENGMNPTYPIILNSWNGSLNINNGTQSLNYFNGILQILNGTNKYSALIWPDSNGAGRFVLGDGTSTKWRTELTNSGLVFRDASDNVTATYSATALKVPGTDSTINTLVTAIISSANSAGYGIHRVYGSWVNHSNGYSGLVTKTTYSSSDVAYMGIIVSASSTSGGVWAWNKTGTAAVNIYKIA